MSNPLLFSLSRWLSPRAAVSSHTGAQLGEQVPNPSIERTVAGKPAPAAHVER